MHGWMEGESSARIRIGTPLLVFFLIESIRNLPKPKPLNPRKEITVHALQPRDSTLHGRHFGFLGFFLFHDRWRGSHHGNHRFGCRGGGLFFLLLLVVKARHFVVCREPVVHSQLHAAGTTARFFEEHLGVERFPGGLSEHPDRGRRERSGGFPEQIAAGRRRHDQLALGSRQLGGLLGDRDGHRSGLGSSGLRGNRRLVLQGQVVEQAAGGGSGSRRIRDGFLAALCRDDVALLVELGPIGPGGLAGVLFLDLSVHVRQSMGSEVFSGVGVSAEPHGVDLSLRPFVQVDGSDKGGVDPHVPVGGRAVEAEKDAISYGCPCWTRSRTIEANLVALDCLEFLELQVLVFRGKTDLPLSCSGESPVCSEITGCGVRHCELPRFTSLID
mmetsp:Transcript_1593/g.4166  ORF Transcript_1593/g.4166 Transcript_1593/m.4166 type:complete len:386 (+) Transcript_1593:56-1213(+)